MTLILLAVSAVIVLCIVAYNFAIYALPIMVGITAARFVYDTSAGLLMSGVAGIGAGLASVALVMAVFATAKSTVIRLAALAVFAIPSAIAGYAIIHGVIHTSVEQAIVLNLTCGTAGLFAGIAALLNLHAVGTSFLQR